MTRSRGTVASESDSEAEDVGVWRDVTAGDSEETSRPREARVARPAPEAPPVEDETPPAPAAEVEEEPEEDEPPVGVWRDVTR